MSISEPKSPHAWDRSKGSTNRKSNTHRPSLLAAQVTRYATHESKFSMACSGGGKGFGTVAFPGTLAVITTQL